jgi:hypothetical protein
MTFRVWCLYSSFVHGGTVHKLGQKYQPWVNVSPIRETREGWPLQTFETGVNGDSKSTNERDPSLVHWLVHWALHAGTRDFYPALTALVSPVQNIFFPHRTLFQVHLSPSPGKLGRQSRRVACLLICVSGPDCRKPGQDGGQHLFQQPIYADSWHSGTNKNITCVRHTQN